MEVEEWLDNNQLSIDIFNNKYRNNGESLEAWFDRVSGGDEDVKRLIREKKFLFGGRVLASRGLNLDGKKLTYANCYVIPVDDNLESIFKTAGDIARTYSYGGGCGINISKLAPAGAKVNNAAKESSGALSFSDLYNTTTSLIGQEGRRGALMLSLSSDHPDLEAFITAKSDLGKLTKANISVMVSNDFMKAVEGNDYYTLSFTRETGEVIEKEIFAPEIFDKLVENNWNYAEPGLLFWDRINNYTMLSEHPDFEFEGINPCGEMPLPAYGACCLGSFNLAAYVYESEEGMRFDFDEFSSDIPIVVQAMNNVLEEGLPLHPLPEQRVTVAKWKQIGIGVMGFASALMLLGIKYGSDDSVDFAQDIGVMLLNDSVVASAELADERGPYPAYNYDYVSKSKFYKDNLTQFTKRVVELYGLRNSQLLSIAPTGTLSTLLGVTGGIEPLFATSYNRRTESLHGESVSYKVYDPTVQKIMDEEGITEDELPEYVVTASEISPIDRVHMQAAWQKYIDASISSTVNLPESATKRDIKEIYIEAWRRGLKGITVYRSGCAREGILTTGEETKSEDVDIPEKVRITMLRYMDSEMRDEFAEYKKEIEEGLTRGQWKPIAPDTVYYPVKINIGCGKIKLFCGYSESEQALQDFELRISGSGGCERSLQDMIITMSGIIRLGGTIDNIAKAFKGVRGCNSFTATRAKGLRVLSQGDNCGNAILHAIKKFCERMKQKEKVLSEHMVATVNETGFIYIDSNDSRGPRVFVDQTIIDTTESATKGVLCSLPMCPECNEPMSASGGCFNCTSCGYSKCG